jgi:preprotein translocase subunit SecA
VRGRMTILKTDEAASELKALESERWEELAEKIDDEVLVDVAREIVLYHLDRAWADHLAYVADVQASIHLRALGQQSPLEEFHKLIFAEFTKIVEEAMTAAREPFTTVTITEDGVDLADADLHRSTMTWTYLVHQNQFSSGSQAMQGIAGIFR